MEKICCINVTNANFAAKDIGAIIKVFSMPYMLLTVVALDQDSEFANLIANRKDVFEVKKPSNNTITAETQIFASANSILLLLQKLLQSEPRCIMFSGIQNLDDFSNYKEENWKKVKREKNTIFDFEIAYILEENVVQISFNKQRYNSKDIIRKIKKIYGIDGQKIVEI